VDLETFRWDLLNDVQIRVAATGGFTDDAFTEAAASLLQEANEIQSFEPCRYRSSSGRMCIDGYAFDDADDSLRVFLVHRNTGEHLETLTQGDARSLFRRLKAFLELAVSGRFEKSIDENHPAHDFAETLLSRKGSLSRIRAYLITDTALSTRVKDWPEGSIDETPLDYHIWDINRFFRAYTSNTGLDDVVVDFRDGGEGLPCLAAGTPGSPYKSYLCVVPATLLGEIYDRYGSRLLEGNVRSFLTAKGKVNQGIRRTIIERPEMFFAYNNGISAVASEVIVDYTDTGPRMISATNLQIVNGGQTTASIENVRRIDKAPTLAQTFVPMKLSVLTGLDSSSMVSDISRFANSQNKISDADFFANHPFHQRLEQISRRLLAPARAGMQYETRWFYERARGQYLNEFAKLSPAQRDRHKLTIPKNQVITKIDLARSELSWQERPFNVSAGAQIFFQEFAKRVDTAWIGDSEAFNEEYFRNIVSRIIIFRAGEALVSRQDWYVVGYRAIIVTYTLAKLAHAIHAAKRGVVDLRRIWKQQDVYPELERQFVSVARDVFETLNTAQEAQQNLTQWAKRQGCWELIRVSPLKLSEDFLETLVADSGMSDDARAARAMQKVDSGVDDQTIVLNMGYPYWQGVLAWVASSGRNVPPGDDKLLRIAAGYSGSIPTGPQCKRLLQLKKRCEDAGFVASQVSL
jgi:hypothetical protein